jgi:hypothetical protein
MLNLKLMCSKLSIFATFIFCLVYSTSKGQTKTFNSYLLKAVDSIEKKWSLRGYDINGVFTHDLNFGTKTLKSSRQPATMCVAAQLEIIVTAINIYVAETKDSSAYNFLPIKHWVSTNSGTFKDLVWVNSGSFGTAYALKAYGMGEMKTFKELLPGSFINLNRNNRTGHAVLFVAYIDSDGNELSKYSDKVKGFKYYSSQGKGPGFGGFGYRYAYFEKECPTLVAGKKRDCGIILSDKQKFLNCGMMLIPKYWDKQQRDLQLKEIAKIHSLGENKVNAKYLIQDTIDD